MTKNKMYLCEECVVVFQVHTHVKKVRKPFCPTCGDNADVVPYTAEKPSGQKIKRIRWTEDELNVLQQVKENELLPHQAAILLGRSLMSVHKKVARL